MRKQIFFITSLISLLILYVTISIVSHFVAKNNITKPSIIKDKEICIKCFGGSDVCLNTARVFAKFGYRNSIFFQNDKDTCIGRDYIVLINTRNEIICDKETQFLCDEIRKMQKAGGKSK